MPYWVVNPINNSIIKTIRQYWRGSSHSTIHGKSLLKTCFPTKSLISVSIMTGRNNNLWEHKHGKCYKTWNLRKTYLFLKWFKGFGVLPFGNTTCWRLLRDSYGFGDFICQGEVSVGLRQCPWCGAKRRLPLSHQWVCGRTLKRCTSLALGRHCLQPPWDGRL